jgi:hypothetical protein
MCPITPSDAISIIVRSSSRIVEGGDSIIYHHTNVVPSLYFMMLKIKFQPPQFALSLND